MNKLLKPLTYTIILLAGLSSCKEEIRFEGAHTLSFLATRPATDDVRTGISIRMVPNWKNTEADSIHVFENGVPGRDVSLSYDEAKPEKGTITATFQGPSAVEYVYNAVVASRDAAGKYIIPSEQHPDGGSLIDPDADFIVGRKITAERTGELSLEFKRPVAVARLAISNLAGTEKNEKITGVEITADSGESFCGSTTYDKIDFAQGAADFTKAATGTLTLIYDTPAAISGSFTFAYFTCLPGTYNVKGVTVHTQTSDGRQFYYTASTDISTSFTANVFSDVSVNMAGVTRQRVIIPGEETTYELVSSLSEGTYILGGYESNATYLCLFPPVDRSGMSSIKTSNYCEHYKISSSASLSTFTTDDGAILSSEVELVKSGSNWLIKLKSNGGYMYYSDGKIDFTTSSSAAAHTISAGSSKRFSVICNSQEFYHSGSDNGFGYRTSKSTSNIFFYKQVPPPAPPTESYDIENAKLKQYLDDVTAHPYFTSETFGSYSSSYTTSLMKSNKYYDGNSASNRLDQPAPVVITWTGKATAVTVFDSPSKTTDDKVAEMSLNNKTYAEIYNLIPGKNYYYTATNGTSTVETGEFTPTGRRRMMKVSTNFNQNYAGNCRDLGGLPTLDGKHVKYGLIYRGTNIDGIMNDADALKVFTEVMKIGLDVELRLKSETTKAPAIEGVYRNTDHAGYNGNGNDFEKKDLVKSTLEDLISYVNAGKPAYIHCQIGSDRTGYICCLVEALIGVTQNWCDTDYEITSFASGIIGGTRVRNSESVFAHVIRLLENYEGTTIHDRAYDYVVNNLKVDKDAVDTFISNMKQ